MVLDLVAWSPWHRVRVFYKDGEDAASGSGSAPGTDTASGVAENSDLRALILSALAAAESGNMGEFDVNRLPPITRRALGMAHGADVVDERATIEAALEEKYGKRP